MVVSAIGNKRIGSERTLLSRSRSAWNRLDWVAKDHRCVVMHVPLSYRDPEPDAGPRSYRSSYRSMSTVIFYSLLCFLPSFSVLLRSSLFLSVPLCLYCILFYPSFSDIVLGAVVHQRHVGSDFLQVIEVQFGATKLVVVPIFVHRQ